MSTDNHKSMPTPNIRPTHKPIKNYYAELQEYDSIGAEHEGTVRTAFQNLLQHYCRQADLILVCEKTRSFPPDKGGQGGLGRTDKRDQGGSGRTARNRRIRPDGEIVDTFGLPYGYWEAKDTQDDLYVEADKKFAAGYPSKNIVVQSPTHALLYQHGQLQLDLDITEPRNLVNVLQTFFAYQEENISAWHTVVLKFKETVPELGEKLATLIETERQNNPRFQEAFTNFHQQCQTSINPNLSIAAVEEMLIQHLLTERIFRTVFNNRDFTRRNIIARENDFLTLDGIPEKAFDYRLGNRSALEWIINQYCVKIDKRSGIVNNPNRTDDPQYIVKLIGKVVTVSLDTVKIVEALPELHHDDYEP